MSYNAELQMLREFYLLNSSRVNCFFCGQPIRPRRVEETFGHRRHTKIWDLNYTVHHDDENRGNNADVNLKNCHSTCHRKFHRQLLAAAGKEDKCSPVASVTQSTPMSKP